MASKIDTPNEHPLEVRVIADGLLLADDQFSERHHTAEAFYSSTCDYYRRTDTHGMEVTVTLLRGDEVIYETTIPG